MEELDKYIKLASSGDALSKYRLGFCYDTGYGVPVNKEKAIALYCESADLNCKEAYNVINSIIEEFDEDYILILKEMGSKDIIDKIYAKANSLSEEGDRFYFGRDRELSYEMAVEFYKKASLLDDINAINSLGYCYKYGKGTKKDNNTAFLYFVKGTELKSNYCKKELATCYLKGIGTAPDISKGVELLLSSIPQEEFPRLLKKYEDAEDEIVFCLNEKAFQTGYLKSAKTLCKCYLEGKGTSQDIYKAIDLLSDNLSEEELYEMAEDLQFTDNDEKGEKSCLVFKKLAELGMIKAQDKYGYCLMFGEGIEENEAEAIIWYKKAADTGFPEALYHLGECYKHGWGVDIDKYAAISYFKKSADQEFEDAEYEVGRMYYEGDGVGCDYNVAFPMIKRAADKGNSDGIFLLAKCYLFGHGIEKQVNTSYHLFNSIGYKNEAKFYIGYCNYYGLGTKKNVGKAIEWLEKIKNTNTEASKLLKTIEEEEQKECEQKNSIQYFNDAIDAVKKNDYEKAFALYKKAADAGHVGAQNNLAILYSNGTGCKKSIEQAIYWYKKSAEGGNLIAKSNLAHRYYTGDGVEKSYEIAFKLFYESASTELIGTLEKLGECFELGRGVNKDLTQAFEWYKKAAEKNSKLGQYKLALFYENGIEREINLNESKVWLDRAIEQNYTLAAQHESILLKKIARLNCKQEIEKAEKELYYSISTWKLCHKKNDKTPVQILTEYANDGVLEAQLILGESFLKGRARWIYSDSVTAYKYIKMAADQNHVESQYELGIHLFPTDYCFRDGSAKKEDIETGIFYFQKAAAMAM